MLQCRPYFRNATSVFHRLRTINLAGNGRQPYFLVGRRLHFSRQSGIYYAAAICLLATAVALRFYNLPEHSLSYDEAVAALNARGSFAELVHNTRHDNSSPILYPAALWLAQKAASTEFSIRMLPAAASALTVAAMLFLLPRVGVGRRTALLAALLATVSTAAIEQAQDGREYSIDALLATLLTAGLLWYLRDGKRGLLGACLFLAPLLQYGLVLFGGAVIAVAVVCPPPGLPDPSRRLLRGRVGIWLQRRAGLVGPGLCLLAGCAITYAVTLRYQWSGRGWGNREGSYNWEYYYQGGYDAAAALEFAVLRTWELLSYHLAPATAGLALGAFGILLLASLQRRGCNALALLGLFAVAIAVGAAMLGQYPLGGRRQLIYLGPAIFLAAGLALGSLEPNLAGLARRWRQWSPGWRRRSYPRSAWIGLGYRALGNRILLPGLAAGVIAVAGAADMRADSPYWTWENYHAVRAALAERAPAGDVVYVTSQATPAARFYQDDRAGDYYYDDKSWCWRDPECIRDRADDVIKLAGGVNRIWLVSYDHRMAEELNRRAEQVGTKAVVTHGEYQLYLITTPAERRDEYRAVVSGEPASRAAFDLYLDAGRLYYAKEPCAAADTAAMFLLHMVPAAAGDLPNWSRQHGFVNADFPFDRYGARFDGKCLIDVPLPEYPIDRISTGQYDGGGRLWMADLVMEGQ